MTRTSQTRQVAIIGGGIGGLATAFFLSAEEGVEVTLFERDPRHNAHSSGRSAEILRTAIDDPVTEELALATSELLRDPAAVGLPAYGELADRRGLYVIGNGDEAAPWIERHLANGTAIESSREALRKAAPHFAPKGTRVLHLPSGGRIFGDRLLAALARGALRRGVRILRSSGDALPRIVDGRVVGVELEGDCLPCDSLVIAAGAWSGPMGEAIGAPLPLQTTRRHMWVTPHDPAASQDAPIVWDDSTGFYARPEASTGGVTAWAFSATDLDEHSAGNGSSERHAAYVVSDAARADALAAVREHLPKVEPSLTRAWRGFRDLSPDDRPMLGPDSRVEGLHWCAGLGGHGMTISLAVGQASADAVMGRASALTKSCAVHRFAGLAVAPG